MNDVTTTIDLYVAVWNETDPAQRRDLIAQTWSDDASYLDPMLTGDGHDGLDAMFTAIHEQLPGHRLRRVGAIDSHHDRVRFAWELIGPDGGAPVFAGIDIGIIAADGRLRAITGFLDQTPSPQEGS